MSDDERPPEILAQLALTGYTIERETSPIWYSTWGRKWRMTCLRCGRIFHPLQTSAAVQNMLNHATVEAGQPALCHGKGATR